MNSTTGQPEGTRPSQTQPDYADPDLHLQRLLVPETSERFYTRFWRDVKDFLFPPKLPPLEVTSKPVMVKSVWGFTGGHGRHAGASSLLIHGSVVALMFAIGTNQKVQQTVRETVTLIAPDLAAYVPEAAPKKQQMGGGGGGGDRSPLPASKGRAPRAAPRQFVPPAVETNPNARLLMEPTLVLPPDVQLPNVNMAQWGDPFGRVGPPSNGPGSGGGIGSGSGGGIGSGRGPGFGPGEGGGIGGGVYRIGGGVSSPTLVYKVEPEYSEEARKAKFQGTVVLQVVVDEKGNPRDLRIIRPLGLGLDEKALEAVQKWRFRPGFLNGRAVAVAATVEVNFRLL